LQLKGFIQARKSDYWNLSVVRLNDNKMPTRSDIADLTRSFNRISKFMPVVLLVQYGNFLTFSTSERMKYKSAGIPGEKNPGQGKKRGMSAVRGEF